MQENDKSWRSLEKDRVRQLNRKIAKNCNYMRELMIVLIPFYLLFLFFAVHVEGIYYLGFVEAVLLLFAFLKYSSITEVWSRMSAKQNLAAQIAAFPVSQRGVIRSHFREICFNQLKMAALTLLAGMLFRWSPHLLPGEWLLLPGAVLNTGFVILIKDGSVFFR